MMSHLQKMKGTRLGLKEWYMKRMVRGMTSEEKQSMMEKMMDEFFASMTSEQKKELMEKMMLKMTEKMMEGMTSEDKQELMASMMPAVMSQMFGGEGGMPSMMMQMMRSMMSSEREGESGNAHPCPSWNHKKISSLGSSVPAENSARKPSKGKTRLIIESLR